MIGVTTAFTNAYAASNRFWKLKVSVTRNSAGAVPIDISDRIVSCDISGDWERRSGSASLEIDNYDFSLSPLNDISLTNQVAGVYDPLLDSNHILEIWEGLVTTSGIEYIKKFTGVLGDEIDVDSYPGSISVTARDLSKLLQDTYIYQSKTYAVVQNQPLPIAEKVIQDLITTFLPSGNIVMSVDSPTNYVVGKPDSPYAAKDINLWDAIQQISDAFNFTVMFDEGGFLRMKQIVRDLSTATPVWSFDESQLIKDTQSLTDSDVRNHVMLRVTGLDPIEKKNEASITRYGRRYFEINRSMATIVSTAELGHTLVDNILKDLSFVVPSSKIELPLFPQIQVGDIVTINNSKTGSNAINYRYRVTSARDSFSADNKRTSVTLSGYYLYNAEKVPAPKPPTNVSGNFISRSIQNYSGSGWTGNTRTTYYPMLTWTAPTQNVSSNAITADFGGYTIFRKGPADTGFYPVANIKSYIAALGQPITYWYDYTAGAGATQYKLVAINKTGQVSTETTPITANKLADTIT